MISYWVSSCLSHAILEGKSHRVSTFRVMSHGQSKSANFNSSKTMTSWDWPWEVARKDFIKNNNKNNKSNNLSQSCRKGSIRSCCKILWCLLHLCWCWMATCLGISTWVSWGLTAWYHASSCMRFGAQNWSRSSRRTIISPSLPQQDFTSNAT